MQPRKLFLTLYNFEAKVCTWLVNKRVPSKWHYFVALLRDLGAHSIEDMLDVHAYGLSKYSFKAKTRRSAPGMPHRLLAASWRHGLSW